MGQMEVARGIFQKDFSRTPTIQHFARGGAYSRKAMEQVHQTSAAGLLQEQVETVKVMEEIPA